MIQLLPKCFYNVGFGGANANIGVLGGVGAFEQSITFGNDWGKSPVVFDSTFRYLTVLATTPFPSDITITLYVEGAATTQAVTLSAGNALAVSGGADVAVTAGQDIAYHYSGPHFAGLDLAICLEREGDDNIYALTPFTGGLTDTFGRVGGAFNNGVYDIWNPALPSAESGTYSICAISGTLTTLLVRTYAGAPGSGVWTGYVRVNGVMQDGTGGSVDTATVLTGANTTATGTFSLPVTLGQHVEVVVVRTGGDAAYAISQVGVGIGFTPSTADIFMLCGGDNDVISNVTTQWKWTDAEQLAVAETRSIAPISATGMTVIGMYIEKGVAPGTGTSYVHTLRRSGTDTTVTVTVAGLALTGVIDDLVEAFVSGQTITLQSVPVPDGETAPAIGQLHWGLIATTVPPPEPEPPGVTYETVTRDQRRLRRAAHLSDEHRWLTYDTFQLDLQAGVGLTTGQGDDPQVMVRWSNDGGHTWSNEHWRTAGRQGARKTRVIVRQTGRARLRTFEVVVSDPVAWFLAAAYLEVTPGDGT